MSKTKKIIYTAIGCIIILSLATLMFIGNYFFNYALVRTATGVSGGNRTVEPDPDIKQQIQNTEKLANQDLEETQNWKNQNPGEDVQITSSDGLALHATKYSTCPESKYWSIIFHGYSSDQEAVHSIAMHYSNEGYNTLTPDLRSHGKSDGKYIGMGWLDRKDALKWIDSLIENDNEVKIILHGVSMGAATVMMTSGEKLPKNIKCIIEDCGYTSAWDIFSSELKLRFGLPSFPILNLADLVTRVRAGYGLQEASALEQIKKSITPMLFIHGDSDNFIPLEMVFKLHSSATCKKDILIIPGADHSKSRIVSPEKYYNRVFEFINTNS